ncbi:MAG: type II toxin-antitoxin system HicA family toxin [Janthinobacterium lividum]
MSRRQKFLAQLLSGQSDRTLDFSALCNLLLSLGFQLRIKGSHHIFTHPNVAEIINLQPASGSVVKPYQAKQVRELLIQYQLQNAVTEEDSEL